MLKLVKSVGAPDGAPHKCKGCGSGNFTKCGIAFNCMSCGQYYAAQLVASPAKKNLQRNLDELDDAHKKLKGLIGQLEALVKR